ncbi:unnamed protein product [Calicophoron daubneyi]|uniref:Uncharacterized protein n=1 Tax=Calicophoron daubneyi TaxID=300641 RepID=A0AAV2T3G0_CALDB
MLELPVIDTLSSIIECAAVSEGSTCFVLAPLRRAPPDILNHSYLRYRRSQSILQGVEVSNFRHLLDPSDRKFLRQKPPDPSFAASFTSDKPSQMTALVLRHLWVFMAFHPLCQLRSPPNTLQPRTHILNRPLPAHKKAENHSNYPPS